MDIIFTIGIFLSFFQFVLLLNKKSKSLPDKILSVWMLTVGIHLSSYYFYYLGYWEKYPHLIGITVPFPLLYGPILYLYTLYLLKNFKHIRKKDYLHFAPVVVSYLFMLRFYFFYSAEKKLLIVSDKISDFDTFSNLLLISFIISGISYSIFSFKFLNKYKQLIEDNFSNSERINLNWLRYSIWVVGLIFITVLIIVMTKEFTNLTFSFNLDNIFYSMLVLSMVIFGYYGIRHQNIFVDNVIIDVNELKSKEVYKKSGLKKEDAISKYNLLLEIMVEKKPYLEPKLSLNSLARYLEISPNYLSQIINQFEQQNFNDFINKYRVNEFIKRAYSNKKYSFLAHALDSGFNSKSTFNTVFKKQKGTTPSQFMTNYRK